MEQLPAESPWFPFVSVDPEKLGGEPVFRGSRVPIQTLFDYLKRGHDLSTFLSHFDGVTERQAQAVLDLAAGGASTHLRAA